MDISAVKQGLADAADVIPGLNCFGYTPEEIPAPAFYAGEVDIDYDSTFGRGLDTLLVTCRLLVSRADDRAGQLLLDTYFKGSGPTSIKAALEAARGEPGELALNGACDDFHVTRVQSHRLYLVGATQYFGAEILVRVYGDGS